MVCRGWCWVLFSLLLHTTMSERMALPPASASRSKPFSGDPSCRPLRAIQQQCCVATVVEVWTGFMLLLLRIGLQLVNSIIIMLIINSHYTTTPLLIYISVDNIHRAFWWVLYFLQILENVFRSLSLGKWGYFQRGIGGKQEGPGRRAGPLLGSRVAVPSQATSTQARVRVRIGPCEENRGEVQPAWPGRPVGTRRQPVGWGLAPGPRTGLAPRWRLLG